MADPVRDFLLDEDGDLAIVNGDFALVAGEAAVKQGIKTRLQMFLGECFLDESVGVDWIGSILIKNPSPALVREELREAIAATPDVISVAGLELEIADREGEITYRVNTVYSDTPLTAQVEAP